MNIHDFLMKYRLPLFAPEDEKGGGDGAADEPGTDRKEEEFESKIGGGLLGRGKADDDAGEGDGDQGDKGEAKGDDKRPDGIPDGLPVKFWKDGAVNQEAMTKAYNDLETAHGKLKRDKGTIGGEVPEDAADYFKDGLELPDNVERLSVEGPDDPGLKAWGEVCKEMGVGKDLAVKLAQTMFGKMDQFADAPLDPDAEFDKLGKGAEAVIEGVEVWARGLEQSKQLSTADVEQVNELSKTADGIRFLANMRAIAGEERIPLLENTGEKAMTQATWNEAYKAAVAAKDYPEQERLDEIGKQINGTEASTGGRPGGVNVEKNGLKRRA